jgi:hypothetical protein
MAGGYLPQPCACDRVELRECPRVCLNRSLVRRIQILAVVRNPDGVRLGSRVRARGVFGDSLVERRVHDADLVRAVLGDVDELAVRACHHVMRKGPDRDVLDDREILLRDDRELVAALVGGVDLPGSVRCRDADGTPADGPDGKDISGRRVERGERVRAAVEALDGPDGAADGYLLASAGRPGDRADCCERADQQCERGKLAHGGPPLR